MADLHRKLRATRQRPDLPNDFAERFVLARDRTVDAFRREDQRAADRVPVASKLQRSLDGSAVIETREFVKAGDPDLRHGLRRGQYELPDRKFR